MLVTILIAGDTRKIKGGGEVQDTTNQNGLMIGNYQAKHRDRDKRAFASFRFRPKGILHECTGI